MNLSRNAALALAGAVAVMAPAPVYAQNQISFLVIDYDAPGMGDWWHLLVDSYNEKSGNEVVPRNTPSSDYYSQLLIQVASGAGTDVITVNPNNLGELLAAEALLPLNDMIEAAGLKDLIVDGGFDTLSKDGMIYALPITGRTLELIYNACYFEEAGITALPTTPEEFRAAAEKLVVRGDGDRVVRYGANMVNANEDPTYEMLLMWSLAHGGGFSDADGNFTVNSQPVFDALNFMKGLYDANLIPKGLSEQDQRSLFATGGSAMTIDGQWQFPFIQKNNAENFDCYKSARHPWDGPATGGVNMAMAIGADSKYPEAAFEFLAMAASPELQSLFSDYSPFIPYGVSALTAEQLAAKPYLKPYVGSSGTAHPVAIPGHADQFNEIWPIIVDATLQTLRNNVPAEEALATAQADLEKCCSK